MTAGEPLSPRRHPDPIGAGVAVIDAFRRCAVGDGYGEAQRSGLSRHHDTSIRFTNSTISAMKPLLDRPLEEGRFLVQPAVRLRNLDYWRRTSSMSGYGCSFVALGTLAPPGEVQRCHEEAIHFLVEGVGVGSERIVLRASSEHPEMVTAARTAGGTVEVDGYDQARYRHVYGVAGLTGRNTNIAIRTSRGVIDVANVIVMERDGRAIAVEVAYGVNMLVALRDDLDHPVLATPGALAADHGVDTLIAIDCLGTAVTLMTEGLRPVARGRGGRLRGMLSTALDTVGAADWAGAAETVAHAEAALRRRLSEPEPGLFAEETPATVAARVGSALAGLRGDRA